MDNSNSLAGIKVNRNFLIVPGNEHCATLVVDGGNPELLEDRIAFIEKSPRVLHNGEWVYGNKGSSDCGQDRESQQWCLDYLTEHGAILL